MISPRNGLALRFSLYAKSVSLLTLQDKTSASAHFD